MSEILEANRRYAGVIRDVIKLRGEPVAVKLIEVGKDFPEGYEVPDYQMSHCQAVFAARDGNSFALPEDSINCKVGASALWMTDTPEKIESGEFHANIGMHDTVQASAEMIAKREKSGKRYQGEVVCPLKDADFEPDVVLMADIPEHIYWIVPFTTSRGGGRAEFSTGAFMCACEDVTAVPMIEQRPNISLGCFGCRKKTPMKSDEMACGIPYAMIPSFVEHLERYSGGVMPKAKRD
ncbi:MAG: DUF169 domain-containing protein [Candidatus Methanomethylophilaceae archaeon]|nr:DUF169 domain-containing protein [Candidatus Methanomethylophilaceae archaeon]